VNFRPVLFALTTLVVVAAGCASAADRPSASRLRFHALQAEIVYAVDGDTLLVSPPGEEPSYVRLVGIDTPEDVRPDYPTECGAEAAAARMDRLAPEGARVLLRPDSVAAATDRYGRLLAHAFISHQLELAQLRRGWAYVYRFHNQRFDGLSRFERAERSARRAHRGIWGLCRGDFHSSEPGVQN
jgi:micrococcal nuclease